MKIIVPVSASDRPRPADGRRLRLMRHLSLLMGVAAAALPLAACGGSPTGSPSTAGSGGGTPASAQSPNSARLVKFSECMRSHGVPDFPDPVNGRLVLQGGNGDLNPSSPAFQSASQACKSLAPQGTASPAQAAQSSGQAVKFAQCMRAHGVPNFPDPKAASGGNFQLTLPSGVDPNSPRFQAAQRACQSLSPLPGGGGAP